jgi:choline dehydrogenase-like flavoprotein
MTTCEFKSFRLMQILTPYSIIGGGTAGLTIAARLTEDPQTSVLVLEAGNDHSNDTNVLSPGLYTGMYGNPEYDWDYKTVPQVAITSSLARIDLDDFLRYTQTIKL